MTVSEETIRALDIPEAEILVRRIMQNSSIRNNSTMEGCRSSHIAVEFRSNSRNNMVVEHQARTIGVRFRMCLR
jgi:ppGpp synthetase/RelA/SpoT-type nucleotidyltranferase